jgi:CRP-like cAMP-binding protein
MPTEALVRRWEAIGELRKGEREALLGLAGMDLKAGEDALRQGDLRRRQRWDGFLARYKILEDGRRQIISFHIAGDMPDLQGL